MNLVILMILVYLKSTQQDLLKGLYVGPINFVHLKGKDPTRIVKRGTYRSYHDEHYLNLVYFKKKTHIQQDL